MINYIQFRLQVLIRTVVSAPGGEGLPAWAAAVSSSSLALITAPLPVSLPLLTPNAKCSLS